MAASAQPTPKAGTWDEDEDISAEVWGHLISINPNIKSVELLGDAVTMGRSSACTVTLSGGVISSNHCTLKPADDGPCDMVLVTDTSTNGTYIDGKRIGKGKQCILRAGQELSLGVPSSAVAKRNDKYAQVYVSFMFKQPGQSSDQHAAFLEEGGPGNTYDCRNVLGTGAFAEVRLCVDKATGKQYAAKIIDKKKFALNKELREAQLLDEVNILKALDHPSIIKVIDIFETDTYLSIILELVMGGDLFDRIVAKKRYPEGEARIVFKQMLEAVGYLHSQSVSHRDLKPENFLVIHKNDDTLIKLSDFGLSRVYGNEGLMKTLAGTPQYLAPEIINSARGGAQFYTNSVDVWSLGVILFVLLVGYPPFGPNDYDKIAQAEYSLANPKWDVISDEAKDLLSKILVKDSEHRLTAVQCLEHEWFDPIRDQIDLPAPSVDTQFSMSASQAIASVIDGTLDESEDTDGEGEDDAAASPSHAKKRRGDSNGTSIVASADEPEAEQADSPAGDDEGDTSNQKAGTKRTRQASSRRSPRLKHD